MRKIGIIGGGQLGRMAIEEAGKYGAHVSILAPEWPCPAGGLADEAVLGPLEDRDSIFKLAAMSDVVSCEIEHVNADALAELEAGGKLVIPASAILRTIQDRAAQKRLWDKAGIPSAPWAVVEGDAPTREALDGAVAALGGYPAVQKARRGGYDGKGVKVITDGHGACLPVPSIVEGKVEFLKELAVVVARGPDGRSVAYPCVEMVFDPAANLCDSVLVPARADAAIQSRARKIALACVDALCGTVATGGAGAAGVFGVELFLLADGSLLVNEVAPRPHNSGHFSIEACVSSQFDQYLRILLGLPLGSPGLLAPAMMVNLFGGAGQCGRAACHGLEEALAIPGVTVHLYGKVEVRPFRKMGHLTAIAKTREEAIEKAERARSLIRLEAT